MSNASPTRSEQEVQRLRARIEQLEAEAAAGREAQQQLNFLKARRQSHLDNTPLAALFWDTDFRILEWNPAAERIFGYSAAEALGAHALDLIVPEDAREHVETVLHKLLQQGRGARSTNDNITKDGQRVVCDWHNTPVVDDQGKVVGAFSLAADITEQRETAQALSQSEGMLRSIVENAPDIIFLVDRQSHITYINHVEAGLSRSQVIGQPVESFVLPEDRPKMAGAIKRVFATGQPEEYEVREIRDGRWYHSRLAPVTEEGETRLLVAICMDIDRLRRQESALRQSEQRLRLVTSQLPAVLWTTDNELQFTSSSGAGLAALGLGQGEVVGRTLFDFFQTNDREFQPIAASHKALRGESVNYEHELSDRWYRVHVEPLRDDADQALGTIGIALDITDQKLAELERAKSQRTFEILAENVPGVVYVCNNDERYSMLYLSNEVEKLLGIPAAAFHNNEVSFVELYHPEEASSIPSMVGAAVAQRAPFHLRYRLRHASGEWIWVEEHGQGVYDEDGELRYLVGGVFDITTRRRAEEALLRSKQELEDLVQVRTQELRTANRLLREDYKRQLALTQEVRESEEKFRKICEDNLSQMRMLRRMLVVHDRDRQLIAYEIHDGIVQYMTGINMFLQGAEAKVTDDPDGAREDLQTSAKLLSETIEEARRLVDGLRPGVLEDQGVVPAVKYLCGQTKRLHDVTTECETEVQFQRLAPAVEMAIYRIVQEGLNNIVKHSQARRARVVLWQRDDHLIIKIEDWGVGFDPASIETKRYGLVGIRDRARLLGGKAKIRTQIGAGTRLRIKLPLQDVLLPQGWQQPEADWSSSDDSSGDWRNDADSRDDSDQAREQAP